MVLSDSRQGGPPQLHVFNTRRGTFRNPVQTSFSLPYNHRGSPLRLLSAPHGHLPFLDELNTAPFYSDPSQRITALNFGDSQWFVINTGKLLELALVWEGKDIQWNKWEAKLVEVTIGRVFGRDCIRVSGCRLFCIAARSTDIRRSFLRVLDFSHAGRTKELDEQGTTGNVETAREWSLSLDGYELPWLSHELYRTGLAVAREGIVFCFVSGVDLSTVK